MREMMFLNAVITGSKQSLEITKNTNMKYLIRDDRSNIEETLKCIEKHFRFCSFVTAPKFISPRDV